MPPKAQTTKQAKASFKARGSSAVTESERKHLLRAIELEQRAERLQEQEKRRQEVARRKAAQAKADKLERDRAQIGSQRRLDRFGYKSSQLHLGGFFVKPHAGTPAPRGKNLESMDERLDEADEDLEDNEDFGDFGDEDIDDASLLEALNLKVDAPAEPQLAKLAAAGEMPPPTLPASATRVSGHRAAPSAQRSPAQQYHAEDLEALWDDLDSSTQIARELSCDLLTKPGRQDRKDSFGSGSFDLTLEDLNEIDPPAANTNEAGSTCAALTVGPAGAIPKNVAATHQPPKEQTRSAGVTTLADAAKAKPPAPPVHEGTLQQHHVSAAGGASASLAFTTSNSPFTSARQVHMRSVAPAATRPSPQTTLVHDLDFTSTQLENLIDDDLQLTPGPRG